MEWDYERRGHRLLCAGVAAALGLSLAACGEKPPAAPAAAKIESAADAAARQAKQAAAAAEQEKAKAVTATAGAKADADAALAAKVKAAITATRGLANMAMDVRAAAGKVTLFGTADDEAQRRQAEKIAAAVPGVKSVTNELHIVRGS